MTKDDIRRKEYVHYSLEQRQQARDTDIIDFLGHYEGLTFHRAGSGYRCDQHNSLVVNKDRKMWYWNSQNQKGVTAIDYLQSVHNKSYLEAMDVLIGKNRAEIPLAPRQSQQEINEEKHLQLPDKCKNGYKRIYAYLIKTRGLDQEIVDYCIKEKIIYQDIKNNAVFVGHDDEKKARFACVRGTLSERQHRGDCSGSDKAYPFKIEGTEKNRLYVFESPIDMLSYITLSNQACPGLWKNFNFISLAGTTDVALKGYLERNTSVTSIIFCLDNDEAGNKASEEYIKKYSDKGINTLRKAPKGKDFNEDLLTHRLSFQALKKEGDFCISSIQARSRK